MDTFFETRLTSATKAWHLNSAEQRQFLERESTATTSLKNKTPKPLLLFFAPHSRPGSLSLSLYIYIHIYMYIYVCMYVCMFECNDSIIEDKKCYRSYCSMCLIVEIF